MKRFSALGSAVLGGAVVGFVALAGPMMVAQAAPQSNGPVVHMIVTVEARHGNEPPALNREDVRVMEGKARDQVVSWVPATGDHAGLEIFFLIDDASRESLGSQLQDIAKFISAQAPTTKIGIAYMQDGIARVLQPPTDDHDKAAKALRLPLGEAGVNGSPYFALTDLVKKWAANGNAGEARREVFMVSDGIDRYYGGFDLQDPYVDAALEDAQRAGVLVYAIYSPGAGHFGHDYWRTYWGQLYLSKVADETGAEGYYIGFNGPPVAFAPYLEDFQKRLDHQYLLAFVPQPQKKTGLQRVKVTTEVPNAELVTAARVLVPANQ